MAFMHFAETKNQNTGRSVPFGRSISEALDDQVMQSYGPLRRIVVPHGHSRQSASSLMHMHLQCKVASRAVDFGRLRSHLGLDPAFESDTDDDDDLPLDVLGRTWCGDGGQAEHESEDDIALDMLDRIWHGGAGRYAIADDDDLSLHVLDRFWCDGGD